MAGFDDPGVFYSEPFFSEEHSEGGDITHTAAQRRFKDFIKTFLDHDNIYSYRLDRPAEKYNNNMYVTGMIQGTVKETL